MGTNVLKIWSVAWLVMAATGCGVPQNSIEAQTAREAAAANCDAKGKCVKDPNGLVLYNSDLVTENFVLKRPDQNPTLLTRLMNLIDEPKLLVTADKLEPLIRGVAIVGESEPCDSPKGIDGANPTVGQLRSLKQGRYKACITYIGDGLFKRAYALSPIDVDTTPPEVAKIGVTHTAVTPTTAGLAWSKAGDNLTLDGKLVYSVYTSKTNVLDSLEAVRTHGNLVPGLLIGGMSYTITSLSENTNYHAAVVVTDEAGNQSLVGHSNFRTTTSDTNPSDTNPPTSPSVVININDSYTNTTAVTLTLSAGEASEMYVTNTEGCTSGGTWQPYVTSKSWTLAQTNATATAYAKFRDLAGNETGCVNDTIIHDDTAPLAPVISDASRFFSSIFATSIQQNLVPDDNFKEFRYTTDGTDPTCSTGTASATVPTSVIIPASTTTLKAISCDELGQGSPISSVTYTYDNSAPTAAITTSATSPTKISPIPVTITFSEVVTGFDISDISVGNGTPGGFTGSGTTYTANITPAGQGAITVDVHANKAQDAANNGNTAASQLSITHDNSAPTVAIASNRDPGPTNNASILLTFTFSEAVTGFDATDVSVNNATKGTFTATSSTVYTLAVTPTGSILSASVAADSAVDSAANGNLASTPWSITYDNTAPTAFFTSNRDPGPTNSSSITLTLTFSEPVSGVFFGDFAILSGSGTLSAFTAISSSVYTVLVTPSAERVRILYNGIPSDDAGNELADDDIRWEIKYDNTAPVSPVIDASKSFNSPFNAAVQQGIPGDANFKEFRYTTNGTDPTCLTGTASSSQPTSVAIPVATTTLKVITCDLVGLASPVSTSVYTFDDVAPAVSVTSTTAAATNVSPIPVTITFSESVTGFDLTDLTVGNGTAGSFSGSGTTYTANITPTADGAVTVDVAANRAQDAATNGNTAATQLSITYDSTPPTSPNVVINSAADYTSTTAATLTLSAGGASEMYVSNTAGCATGGTWEGYGASKSWMLGETNATATVYAKFRDLAGNETACVSDSIIHDNTSPTLSVVSMTPASPSDTTTPIVNFTLSEGATVTLFNGSACSTAISSSASKASGAQTLVTNSLSLGTYNIYAKAVDAAGNNSACTLISENYQIISVPGAPTGILATALDQSVSLTWTAPGNNGGSAITGYKVERQLASGGGWAVFSDNSSASTSITVTGLTNGTAYIFRVAAKNAAGAGSYSSNSSSVTPQPAFISTWKTDNTTVGSSTATQVKLPLESTGTYNFTVDWGDGSASTITTWNDANTTHTYAAAGTYTLTIVGTITGFRFNNSGDREKITNISKFGPLRLGNNGGYFWGARRLTITATDVLDLTGTTTLANAFYGCNGISTVPSMNSWDTSSVTIMSGTFQWTLNFNQNISNWNTSAVTTMANMFMSAPKFNQDISNWNTANVTDMNSMFYSGHGYSDFNQNIGSWNTANVTNMSNMFRSATAFNQNIGSWNTANVTNMSSMFLSASAFNQNLGSWNVVNATNMSSMFTSSGLTRTNYDPILTGWQAQNVKAGVTFSAGSAKYTAGSAAANARLTLTTATGSGGKGWTITDGGGEDVTTPSLTLSSSTPSPTNGAITVTATFDELVTGFEVGDISVTNGTAGSFSGSGSSYSFTVTPTAEGAVSISVASGRAQDSSGNENTASNALNYVYDNTTPLAPVISDVSRSFSASFAASIQQGVPADSNFKEFRYTTSGLDPTCSTGTVSSTQPTNVTIPAATTTLKAITCDLAGNVSGVASATYTYDITPPNAPTVTGTTPTASTTPTWSWSSGGNGGNGTFRYKLNDANLSSGATETASTTFTPGSALPEATHTLYVQERDAAGNWSASGSFAIQVVTPPAAPTLSTAARYVTSLGLSWASVAGATSYNLYWSTTSGVTTSSTKISGVTSVYTHSSLSGGAPYYYKLAAVKNGVEGSLSNEVSGTPFVGQAVAPVMSPAAGTYASTQTVTLTSTTNGAAIYYRLDGVAASCSSGTPYTGSITVTSTTTISSIACASDHQDSTLSSGTFTIETITADNGYGRFFGWGFNSDGRLGNGTTSAITSPSQIGSDSDWTALVHSMYHSAGIRLGKLYTWGRNVEGQLGNGTTTNSLSPIEIAQPVIQVNTDNRWTHVSVGWYHTVAIRGGKLYAWGENNYGQLGDGTNTRRNTPVQIGTDSDWTLVSAGGNVTVGIRGGKLYGWGSTEFGVIGNNATSFTSTDGSAVPIHRVPMQIGTDSDWTHVSTSGTHTLGIRNNGRLYALGYNEYGKLGDGTTVNKNTLTQIGTASDWTSVSTGRIHSVGLRSGVVFAWGSNWYGQLGTGGFTNSASAFVATPQQIGVENTWSMVSAADDHTMAIRGGSLYGWGANHNRQLGDGTTTQRNTPTLIGSSTDWIYIWAGGSVSLGIQKPAAGFVASCAGDCYMEGSAPGYAQSFPIGTERVGPDGLIISLQHASGSSGFKIWKEKNGSRILNSAGITSNGWQQGLTRAGTSFSSTDFTISANIAGRVCPTNVFINYSVMTAANRCLYYDAGNSMQALDGAGTAGVEATDWLQNWNSSATGRGAGSSYYEGNIKTCADKGMRLPTLYETSADPSASTNLPTSDGISPIWSVSTGVPHFDASGSWTASGNLGDSTRYFRWRGTGISFDNFGIYSNTDRTVRCVLPNSSNLPAPSIAAVSPDFVAATPGTVVTITGTGFVLGATVSIGSVPAASVTFVSATSMQATIPVGASGAKSLVVTNTDGQNASIDFTVMGSLDFADTTNGATLPGTTPGGAAVAGIYFGPSAYSLSMATGSGYTAVSAIFSGSSELNTTNRPNKGSSSGSTWYTNAAGSYMVIDLGQTRTFSKSYYYQMFSDGKTTHASMDVSSTLRPYDDAGWIAVHPESKLANGNNNVMSSRADMAVSFIPVTGRYIRLKLRNDGSYSQSTYTELFKVKIFQ